MRRHKSVSRLRVIGIPRWAVVVCAIACGAVAGALCVVLGSSPDRTVGVVGAVLAVATFGFSQWQTDGPRHRKVIMIPKSRSPFSTSVHRGLADNLNEYPAISLVTFWPEGNVESELEWQLSRLRVPEVLQSDGLVIVPAADDESLWSELAHISRAGLFIVVVDTKPENAFFVERDAPRPCFVGSNFSEGGDCLGKEMARLLEADATSRAVVALGPEWSWPGRERSCGITIELCSSGVADRTKFVNLEDWNKERAAALLTSEATKALSELDGIDSDAPLLVYCGNDKIMASVDRELMRSVPSSDWKRVILFGYDGALSLDGNLLISGCEMSHSTIDTRPEFQGSIAAELLIDEHRGLLTGRRSRYVDPVLVRK